MGTRCIGRDKRIWNHANPVIYLAPDWLPSGRTGSFEPALRVFWSFEISIQLVSLLALTRTFFFFLSVSPLRWPGSLDANRQGVCTHATGQLYSFDESVTLHSQHISWQRAHFPRYSIEISLYITSFPQKLTPRSDSELTTDFLGSIPA